MIEPGTIEEAASIIRAANKPLFIRGGGTKFTDPPHELPGDALCTRKLARIVEYQPSDQVVTVEAGVTLAQLQAELAKHGQRLALDPPFAEQSTLGGIVASNAFGPLRTRYGSVRDLIIGVSILRSDGTRAKGGGKVVKTVAGFDLPKLMCGSEGTLGLIATATFRVHPVPEAVQTVAAQGLTSAEVNALVARMRELQLEPAAVVAVRTAPGRYDVAVRFEGFGPGVVQQEQKLGLPRAGDAIWARHEQLLRGGPFRARVSALPTALAHVEEAVAPLQGELHFYPMVGVGFLAGAGGDVARARENLRGSLVIERGAGDRFGPPPAALALHKAVKARFDPAGRFGPGRFVGGI